MVRMIFPRGALLTVVAMLALSWRAPALADAARDGPAGEVATPALVVLITVDQMRADYLDRFGPQLTGGLGRLVTEGARFTDAHQDHAITETAPGHATLLSGREPRSTGIVSNWEGVEDDQQPLLDGAPGEGASPARFRGTVLIDWLQARDRRARQLSVAGKDRGAILPAGRSRSLVYWYAENGRFTTSRYYADRLPDWVTGFNDRGVARRLAGQRWTLLLPDSAYPEADDVAIEGAGRDNVFPHLLSADSAQVTTQLRGTPFLDGIVLDFALDGLQAVGLGRGPRTDVLSISLSSTDAIGHRFGPDSREMHDQILRLDRALGGFLDSLYRLRAPESVLVVLTADHGIGTIPELAPPDVQPMPTRLDPDQAVRPVREALAARTADPDALYFDGRLLIALDRKGWGRVGVSADSVLAVTADLLRSTKGVQRVDRFADLARRDLTADTIARRWVRQLPAPSPVDYVVTLTPLSLATRQLSTHGSPHDYDTHVPLIFHGAGIRAGTRTGFVRTVDIAPTLADMLGVRPTERLDGESLRKQLR